MQLSVEFDVSCNCYMKCKIYDSITQGHDLFTNQISRLD